MNTWFHTILDRLGLGRKTTTQPADAATGARDATVETTPPVDGSFLIGMVRAAMSTRDDEMDCDECYAQVDAFVELHLSGKDAAAAMPLVADHLQRCPPCREEFEALLVALAALEKE